MGTTAIVAISLEVAKALLALYFQYIKQSGMTAEEGEKLYLETRLTFLTNNPSQIPTV